MEREKKLKVDFPIKFNPENGRIHKRDLVKIAKLILNDETLKALDKKDTFSFFVVDSNNVEFCFYVCGRSNWIYSPMSVMVSCSVSYGEYLENDSENILWICKKDFSKDHFRKNIDFNDIEHEFIKG